MGYYNDCECKVCRTRDAAKASANPYPAGDIRADAWQRGFDGRPMMDMAHPSSNYATAHREGQAARAAGVRVLPGGEQ